MDDAVGTIDIPQYYKCSYDGIDKIIHRFGHHIVGCDTGENAIRIHSSLLYMVANLFRSLGLYVQLEPTQLFAYICPNHNPEPALLITNPYGGSR